MSSNSSKFPIIVLILALCMIGFGLYNLNKIPTPKYPEFDEKLTDFTLHGADRSVSFSDLAGKASVVFFGYTHCPDVCPNTLVNFGNALRMLNEDEKEKVRAVFIAIDFGRDTPERVHKYATYFHPDIIGLTGSEEELKVATKAFMVPFEKDEVNAKGNYLMNHGTYVYVMRPDGKLGELISHQSSSEEIVEALRKWIRWAE
ncbi:protein SCO1/2 [Mariprofundus ferrinatatus]|uniref:Protein SCO1/2 n=1 Tax=Mariprofundus ferrinatatus TaxID=1921087 RepID=A0A2K8L9H0_9PROT|nr:SCO family protein [Mariprofundus ferrinatatus]ATX81584.1 protein SCO1/2 [Mariprofundus ferrinatatus]